MKIIVIAAIMMICEIILAFLFALIAQQFYKKSEIDLKSILKGFIERLFLTLFLFNGIPHALTFFSALKLATRLKHNEANGDVGHYNDYYLLGNLVSVSVMLFYVCIWNHVADIELGINRLWG
jgi:nitrogen fixation-related uncharacterized protein